MGTPPLELRHVHDGEFDPDAPGDDVDFNAHDATPADSDTPHNYPPDLIVDTASLDS